MISRLALAFLFTLAATLAGAQQNLASPSGAIAAITAAATATTGSAVAILPAAANKTNYICGFSANPGSATAAITIAVTVSGIVGAAALTWTVGAPATAAGVTGTPLTMNFAPCIPATGTNASISVTSGALGTGGINNDLQVWGFQQ